ncbi:multicopper oxidase domain-containing protein [Candidatus Methylospira mobilis]|uniref:Multicopper oxidase domain-containing protein n=1 Tax=Candidatus Methylospira mobilis TaxID=1808979 RepID=A0A5Q0BQC8_9GAMM|nr:multicopper oxidase domain-containing protein [Candidatus Methylospira mobilis]QFY44288.1 multicopper oxidase domain-containing protein [Candidatus Methylospira mobilis]WNV06287.1 multicopper oxidase domain-containing protein [Candidatus Methylospira mobilis]
MFQNHLPIGEFDIYNAKKDETVDIHIHVRKAKLSDNPNNDPPMDNVWRYIRKGSKEDGHGLLPVNLGPILNVNRNAPLNVHWNNDLSSGSMQGMPDMGNPGYLQSPPINPVPMDYMMPGMNGSVGTVAHLHGAKVLPGADGWPLTPLSFPCNPYGFPTSATYHYPNDQRACMLWFHDHGMDNTGPQVYAGLAGLYFVRDESDASLFDLIGGAAQEIPLVIQDRMVDCDYCCVDYLTGRPVNPADKTFDRPEFLGETIFVNGRAWPHHELSRKVYRLRVLNGSNARTYALALIDPNPWASTPIPSQPEVWHSDLLTVIGNDGGLLPVSKTLAATDYILLAPGERLDLLLDLTGVDPAVTGKLRLVNLAVNSLHNGDWPEAIFQTENDINTSASPAYVAASILKPVPSDAYDRTPLASITGIKQANILQFCLKDDPKVKAAALDRAKLDQILHAHADEDGFFWDGKLLTLPAGKTVARNRLVLLMNNTSQLNGASPYSGVDWQDTQIWEMQATGGGAPFAIPFYVDLTSANPAPGNPVAGQNYKVARATFFDPKTENQTISPQNPHYPALQPSSIKPAAGSYERWYVANIGNQQPLSAAIITQGGPAVPDMHPFHMHLVNFVVQRRFVLNPTSNGFVPVSHANTFDNEARHDTVRIQSNELLELLVYFPPGYSGRYPYHCHLVEHEDMGMMLHFEVS